MKKCKMFSVFTQPDVNTREVGRTRDKRRNYQLSIVSIVQLTYVINSDFTEANAASFVDGDTNEYDFEYDTNTVKTASQSYALNLWIR